MTAVVRLGAWRDTLPGTYDPATSVVITDPPFGIGRKAYVDTIPWADHVRAVLAELPAARHVIRGSGMVIARMDVPAPRRMMIETARFSPLVRPGAVPYRWHGWLVYGRLKVGRRARAPFGDSFVVGAYDSTFGASPTTGVLHDATTPVQACVQIVETWTEAGWTVVDPFAGIGTIGQAAAAQGFDYIGAELDPRWHRTAIERLSVTIQPLGL